MKNPISRKLRLIRTPSRRRNGLQMEALEQRAMLTVTAVGDSYAPTEGNAFSTGLIPTPIFSTAAPDWQVNTSILKADPTYPTDSGARVWNSVNYDVTTSSNGTWATLSGPFENNVADDVDAFDTGPAPTLIDVPFATKNTALARKSITLTAAQAAAVSATLRFVSDDGLAVYLNGVEIFRSPFMPQTGAITPATIATGSGAEAYANTTVAIPAGTLVAGTNVIAMENHHRDGGTDFGFDVGLTLNLPGGPLGTRSNDDLGGAAAANTYYWDQADPADPVLAAKVTGNVYVDPENPSSAVVGTVTVTPATGEFVYTPTNLDYFGTAGFKYVLANAANAADAAEATVTLNIASVNDVPRTLADVYGGSEGTNFSITGTGGPLVSSGSSWSYLDELTATPVEDYPLDAENDTWNSVAFNTASSNPAIGTWKTGNSPFELDIINAFNANGANVTTLLGAAATNTTYLFRRTFDIASGAAAISQLVMDVLADDAAIIYINGQEVYRQGWDAAVGPITSTSLNGAAGAAGAAGNEDAYTRAFVPITAGILVNGTNTIAVELHQNSLTSSDAGFDLIVYNPNGGLLSNDSDIDGPAALTVEAGSVNQAGLAAIGSVNVAANGTFTFTAIPGAAGTGTFTYRAFDGAGASADQTVTITLTPIDSGPVVAVDDSGALYSTVEDTTKTFDGTIIPQAGGIGVGVLSNDTTHPNDVLDPVTLTIVRTPDSGGTVVIRNDGSFDYTPGLNFVGVDTFDYMVSDGNPNPAGNDNIGTVSITVSAAADLPVAVNDAYTVVTGTQLVATLNTALIPLRSTWSYFDDLTNGSGGSTLEAYPTDAASNAWNSEAFNTATSAPALGAWKSGKGVFAQPLNGVTPDGSTFLRGTAATITTDLYRRTFSLTAGEASSITTLFANMLYDDGVVVYINGTEVFRDAMPALPAVIASDTLATANPSENYQVKTLTIPAGTLHAGNNTIAVEVHSNSLTSSDRGFDMALANVPAGVTGASVTLNDFDPDGTAVTTATVVTPPTSGTLDFNADGSGRFTYTPAAGFTGDVTFTYTVASGGDTSAPATVTITVTSTPITAVNDSYSTPAGVSLSVPAPGVLSNDSGPTPFAVLLDGEGEIITRPEGILYWIGPTTINGLPGADGEIQFDPASGFTGLFTYVYTISDDDGNTDTATLSITVGSVIDPDVNNDGIVNRLDLSLVVSNYGATGAAATQFDVNADGSVNIKDAIIIRNTPMVGGSPSASAVVTRAAAVDQAVVVRTRELGAARAQARVRQVTRESITGPVSGTQATDSALSTIRARRTGARASAVDQLFS